MAATTLSSDFGGLGILIIIIDSLPLEDIWRLWLEEGQRSVTCTSEGVGVNRCRIWIHAKYPERIQSAWVRERLVKSFHLKPEWASGQITDCMYRMLGEVGIRER